jgi:thiol-disulfide isomerase/thioredoxin
MLSVPIGPLAVPVAPLVLLAALGLGVLVARRVAGPGHAAAAENNLWAAGLLGLLAARAGHFLGHAEPYLALPWAMVDIRDGGWHALAGWAAGAAALGWRAWRRPALRRALGAGALAAAVVGVGGAAAVAAGEADRVGPPEVVLTSAADGRTVRLADAIAGQPAVVNLWASWCAPCRAEMPVLARVQQRHPDVRFLYLNQGESAATVAAHLAREGLRLQGVWLDTARATGPAAGSAGLPTTLFFDATGRRVDAHFGILNEAALEARLNALRRR